MHAPESMAVPISASTTISTTHRISTDPRRAPVSRRAAREGRTNWMRCLMVSLTSFEQTALTSPADAEHVLERPPLRDPAGRVVEHDRDADHLRVWRVGNRRGG